MTTFKTKEQLAAWQWDRIREDAKTRNPREQVDPNTLTTEQLSEAMSFNVQEMIAEVLEELEGNKWKERAPQYQFDHVTKIFNDLITVVGEYSVSDDILEEYRAYQEEQERKYASYGDADDDEET